MKPKERFQNRSREDLLDATYDLAANFEINSYSCSQCVVAAIHEVIGLEDSLVKAATSNCGGTAFQLLGACGGLVGGIMALDYFFGRPVERLSYEEIIPENITALFNAQAIARELYNKYVENYGAVNCGVLMNKLYGRMFYFEDPDEFKKFEAAGCHTDPSKCVGIVGNAARWVMEILIDKGVVEVD
ncbi:MAG: C_GCAxxG_C_C family protein [Firmicutes bacterium]|nr:C_GCAxxG_C_C family protein [Bacillota bacterium]